MLQSKVRRTNLEQIPEIRTQLCNKLENLPNRGHSKCKDPEVKRAWLISRKRKEVSENGKGWFAEMWGTR